MQKLRTGIILKKRRVSCGDLRFKKIVLDVVNLTRAVFGFCFQTRRSSPAELPKFITVQPQGPRHQLENRAWRPRSLRFCPVFLLRLLLRP